MTKPTIKAQFRDLQTGAGRSRQDGRVKMEHREFLQGFGIAIASLVRSYDQPSMAADIANSNGLDLSDFESCGLEAFDMKPIRKALRVSR